MPDTPTLSPRDLQMLRMVVSGSKLERVPETLVELKLVRVEKLRQAPGLVFLAWKATSAGVKVVAESEGEDG